MDTAKRTTKQKRIDAISRIGKSMEALYDCECAYEGTTRVFAQFKLGKSVAVQLYGGWRVVTGERFVEMGWVSRGPSSLSRGREMAKLIDKVSLLGISLEDELETVDAECK